MNEELITIVGTLLTLGFGLFTLYTYYFRKYPGKISFIKDKHYDLYKTLITNISDLQILYKNKPIDQNRHLLRGYMINNGNSDITKEMVENQLKIKLKNEGKWLTSKVLAKSNNLTIHLTPNDKELNVDIGLFRKNEWFHFEALIEGEFEKDVLKNIEFEHRIANTRKVEIIEELSKTKSFRINIPLLIAYLLMNIYLIYTLDSSKENCFSPIGIASEKIPESLPDSLKDSVQLKLGLISSEFLPFETRDSCRKIAIRNSSIIKLVTGNQHSHVFDLKKFKLYFHPQKSEVIFLRIRFVLILFTMAILIYLFYKCYELFQLYQLEKIIKKENAT